ncbi:ceramidase domain-containing protein [Paracoccus denitrificans]|uniref:ceramidase domain-containing protein n=1 Tax=Paracoccus denitrificans TaxID=266 RepID=UPI000CEC1BA1|nr:ceramidase domain-containing protein [Paracoccus denitrificans]
MNWLAPVDAYCERTGPDYWSEPVNAVTNLAFLIAALVLWRRLRGPEMAMGRALAAVLFVIGIGSWLFHTHANRLTGLMDVLPILGFILLYIFAATRDYFGARPWVAALVTAGFIPYAAASVPLFSMIRGFGSSASYAPVALLILIYAALLRRTGILIVSLSFRTLDQPLCGVPPFGTHFL